MSRRAPRKRATRKIHAADQAHVEPRDGQQVHQPRLREPVLQVGIDAAAAAQHERIHQRRAIAVERAAGFAERGAKPCAEGGVATGRSRTRHHQQAARPPRGPGRGIHRASTWLVCPAATGTPAGHCAATSPLQPARDRLDLHAPALDRHRLGEPNGEADAARTRAAPGSGPARRPRPALRRRGRARPRRRGAAARGAGLRRPRRGARARHPEPRNAEGRSRDRPRSTA